MQQALKVALVSAGALFTGSQSSAVGNDVQSLLQLQESKVAGDIYVSTAHTLDDLMWTAVLHRTMKNTHPMHSHIIQIRKDSPLNKRAHAIRVAMAQGWWNCQLEVFKPDNLNMEAVSLAAWREYAPLSFRRDQYRRVTYLSSDMVVMGDFDNAIHKQPLQIVAARNQGDCKNLTEAFTTTKPSKVVLSFVPDDGVVTYLTSAGTRLFSEGGLTPVSDETPLRKLDTAAVMNLAYTKLHPAMQSGVFAASDILSSSCLLRHKDAALAERDALGASLVHLGTEGKQMVQEIIEHGDARLKNTVAALEASGRKTMAKTIKTWFEAYNSPDVKGVLDAAKNGALAEK